MSVSTPFSQTCAKTPLDVEQGSPNVSVTLKRAEPWIYSLTGGLLILAFAACVPSINWAGDFWEHSAVVRELAVHPWNPSHPQFYSDDPHQFYSPYALTVGLLSRWTGLNAIEALGMAGVLNGILLLVTFRPFVRTMTGDTRNATLALLLTLGLWGVGPWAWSGFLHWEVIGLVLPYPSAFATALAFLSVIWFANYVESGRSLALTLAVSVAVVATLTHPPTAAALAIILLAVRLGSGPLRIGRRDWPLIPAAGLGLVALTLWPYFPFWDLAFADSANRREFHAVCLDLYERIIIRSFPVFVVGVPCLLLVSWNRRRPLWLAFLGLMLVYIAGWYTGLWQLGRMMPWIALMLHLAAAEWISTRFFADDCESPRWLSRPLLASGVMVALIGCAVVNKLPQRLQELTQPVPPSYVAYAEIGRLMTADDVVLGDRWSSWVIPTFGGRGVAAQHAQAFVPDHAERRADLLEFMSPETGPERRSEIAQQYHADYILLKQDADDVPADLVPQLLALGQPVAEIDSLLLIRIGPN
ncbi:MAG: hypothetical protein ACK5Q5_21535 [Planctomycetaceae bacterium]